MLSKSKKSRSVELGLTVALATTAIVSNAAAAKKLTRQQQVDAFLRADKNKDEVLSRAEFKSFMKDLARLGQPTAKRVKFWGVYGMAFNRVDANKNGLLEPRELERADGKFKNCNQKNFDTAKCQ